MIYHLQYTDTGTALQLVSDWALSGGVVTIDGAIVDPQFLRSAKVGLVCADKNQWLAVKTAVESQDLP